MCTVTWLQDRERLALFCNRDELRTRQLALPPAEQSQDDVRFLSPIDRDAGGTWVAVNEHGLVLCLLNDYRSTPPDPNKDLISRGLLVTGLIRSEDLSMLGQRFRDLVLARYRPFKLLALAAGEDPILFSWNGEQAWSVSAGVIAPLSSSSFDDRGAARARSELLASFSSRPKLEPRKRLLRFHQSHQPERGPYSVCMHRPDAVTVSLTVVEVDPEQVAMAYAPGSPCSTPLDTMVTLANRAVRQRG